VIASDRHRSEGAGVAGHSYFTSICLSHFKTNDSVRNCPGDEARNCQGDDHYYILDSITVSPKPVPIIIITGIIRIQSSSFFFLSSSRVLAFYGNERALGGICGISTMAEAGGAFVTRSFEKLLKDAPGRRYAHLHLALKAYLGLSCQNAQPAVMQNSAPLFVFFLHMPYSRFVTNWLFRGFFVPNSPSSMNRGGENSNGMCFFLFFVFLPPI
jgi:hypothetical protein